MPNVHFLGQKRYEELPSYISQFDVCVIPYLLTEYTKNVYPTKINEYLSLGKAVVSTSIPEVEEFNKRNDNIIYIAKTKEEFSSLTGQALSEKPSEDLYRRRIDVAANEGSWELKIEEMCNLIEQKITDKERERAVNWKDNLLINSAPYVSGGELGEKVRDEHS